MVINTAVVSYSKICEGTRSYESRLSDAVQRPLSSTLQSSPSPCNLTLLHTSLLFPLLSPLPYSLRTTPHATPHSSLHRCSNVPHRNRPAVEDAYVLSTSPDKAVLIVPRYSCCVTYTSLHFSFFIFLRPSFFFFFLFPILFVPFIPFPLFTSLHVTALLLPRNGALFAIDVLYFNSPHPLSFLLLTSPYLTSSRLISSPLSPFHLPSLPFTSPLSLSPPHHLISSITPFRFGIEGTILLEPLAAKINSRPESPEGSISSSVKFNSATHTVTIHKVRSSDCCYLCLYSLY